MGPFHKPYRSTQGWAKFNADYWRTDYEDFLRFFCSQVWTEPHSHHLVDTCTAWGLETTPKTLIDTVGTNPLTEEEAIDLTRRTRCPWLDVVGWLPEPDAGDRRRHLLADANAEMADQVERYPRVRDRALFLR